MQGLQTQAVKPERYGGSEHFERFVRGRLRDELIDPVAKAPTHIGHLLAVLKRFIEFRASGEDGSQDKTFSLSSFSIFWRCLAFLGSSSFQLLGFLNSIRIR